jgi:excisionase family DNA binding protein
MTISQFQKQFGVSRSTVYRLRDRHALPFVYIGRSVRIRTEDAENWFQSLTHSAAGG